MALSNQIEARLSPDEFTLFRNLIKSHTGISLSEFKRSLVEARLARQLRSLRLQTYREYYEYLITRDPGGEERRRFINALTTNVTSFFREPHHFEYLKNVWLPSVRARGEKAGLRTLRIWSAGCSSGEEPYSIAITLSNAMAGMAGWDLKILASDVDTEALAKAREGVYAVDCIQSVPKGAQRFFLRARRQTTERSVEVAPELRDMVSFVRINLLDEQWPIPMRLDAIFCRNVLIYFDKPTKRRVVERFESILRAEGLLVLGHSESLLGTGSRLHHLGQTTYQLATPVSR